VAKFSFVSLIPQLVFSVSSHQPNKEYPKIFNLLPLQTSSQNSF